MKTMKTKLVALTVVTALACGAANAVVLSTSFIANTANNVGLITTLQTGSLTNVSGSLTILTSTTNLTSLASTIDTLAEFVALLDTPTTVRTPAFSNGAITSTGNSELGAVSNRIYVWIQSGDGNSWGGYKGNTVPSLGSVVINSGALTDLGQGTSVYNSTGTSGFQLAYIPEPSAALLGALGALGLLRRRRI
jgi:hypothetical protein